MYVKLKKGQFFPLFEENVDDRGYCEVVMSAQEDEYTIPGHNRYTDTVRPNNYIFGTANEYEGLPPTVHSVWIFFPSGDVCHLPIETVNSLFDILPEGELTEVIYGK